MSDGIVPGIESANKLFLEGPFGSGKTTLAVRRLLWLLKQERVRGSDILVLTPQRTIGRPYYVALRGPDIPPGPPVQLSTVAGLARRSVELYWPLLSKDAGFANPDGEPIFLNLETSQYHMGPLVDAALAGGEFQGIRVERNRVISQVLDNLNKAALNDFSIDEAYERLQNSAPPGTQRAASLNALESARTLSRLFREKCLALNLVDYSLQIELFNRFVLRNEWSRTHLLRSYRHLIFDNLEEDTYTAHRLAEDWLPSLESALLVADTDGGIRVFLGASPQGVERLRPLCDSTLLLEDTHTMGPPMQRLEQTSRQVLRGWREAHAESAEPRVAELDGSYAVSPAPPLVVPQQTFKFYPQMIEWVADEVQELVDARNVAAEEIVILAPYLSDALRFSMQLALQERGVPSTTHRPSRPLRNEPATRSLLALAALAHPHWGIIPSRADVAAMLAACISGADPVRASLLASIVHRPGRATMELSTFESLNPGMQRRVTYRVGERYDRLRAWVYAYRAQPAVEALDHFWSRAFGELLSQPGYLFHNDLDAARVTHQLVTAARNFRWAVESTLASATVEKAGDPGCEFVQLVESGAIGALFAGGWEERGDAVLIAPAHTYLMRNRTAGYQFWLDVGSSGWWERLYQPLTHPYVLSSEWPAHQPWTDFEEFTARQLSMQRLVLGLMRRARHGIYVGLSQYSESGYEQRGPLLAFVNRLLPSIQAPTPGA